MSGFYIVGENHHVASASVASEVISIVHDDTLFTYWREATAVAEDVNAMVWMSYSEDNGKTWTSPTMAIDPSAVDIFPVGVIHDGVQFVMVVATRAASATTYGTKMYVSPDGLVWTEDNVINWTEDWSFPTGLDWDGTNYWLTGTVQNTGQPKLTVVRSSINRTTWTALPYPSQLSTLHLVRGRTVFYGDNLYVFMREGDFFAESNEDRILYSMWNGSFWEATRIAVSKATGSPTPVVVDNSLGVLYQDRTLEGIRSPWSWSIYDGAWLRRGVVEQGSGYGAGGFAMPFGTGFAVLYAQKREPSALNAEIYFRMVFSAEDSIEYSPLPGTDFVAPSAGVDALDNFAVEISYGSLWVSLTDHVRYYMSAEDYGDKAQTLRRVTAQSPYYEGSYLVHAVRENVEETLSIYVLGVSQNAVTENLLLLEELVSQPSFRVRITHEDHVETWKCQQADYSIQRGHIMLHNTRAMMRINISRLPNVTYEVNG